MMRPNEIDFLFEILSQPSAPFREHHVIQCILNRLNRHHVPHFIDPVGNLVLGVPTQKAYFQRLAQKHRQPMRLFIAHMDHPGFHGSRWIQERKLEVNWHGGSPTRHLTGARVWLSHAQGFLGHGKMIQADLTKTKRAILKAVITLGGEFKKASLKADSIYGGFAFKKPVWQKGQLLYTKAADDLVGAFAVASLAIENRKRNDVPFLGLLTRAEEVGFIGAIGHFQLGWLQKARRPILCISLETSRTLQGAEIGKGPVVRLGDKATVFDPRALQTFANLAQKVLPNKHQKRIMDGGTCEATVATAFGFPAIGISVPLGNYHNQSFEGGPDSRGPLGPAPEFVHLQDVKGLLILCRALLKSKWHWDQGFDSKLKDFRKNYKSYQKLLESGP